MLGKKKQEEATKEGKQARQLQNQIEELTNNWKRALADYQNLEKQVQVQKRDWIDFATRDLLLKLLPILANLEKSAQHLKDEGLQLSVNQFKKVLSQEGLEEVPIEPGKTSFDTNTMECVDAAQGKENRVLKVLEKGYKLKGRLLKPARVVVGSEKVDEKI